ncbi:MAG: AAA family ATPase [Candidatus Thermoplasmatota archaeon]|nr:AAA family ATPase [Candidatus Thermoplasmatota archaeon]
MPHAVAVCGMPGSGKGEFAKILADQGIPVRSMGDMIRAEVKSRGIEGSPDIYGEVAADLRAEFGEDVLAIRLADEVSELLETNSIVLIEGMRGTAEYEIFSSRWSPNFSSVAITANQEIRFQRTQSRGRPEDGDREQFQIREEREAGWGLYSLIENADFEIKNESSLEDLVSLTNNWLAKFTKNKS